MSSKANIKKLILLYNQRLQLLREKEALQGLNTPPEVQLEIEDIEAKLEMLRTALQDISSKGVVSEPETLTMINIDQELARLEADEQSQSSMQIGSVNISKISGSSINVSGNLTTDVRIGGDFVGSNKISKDVWQAPSGAETRRTIVDATLVQFRRELEVTLEKLTVLDDDDKEYVRKTLTMVEDEIKKGVATDPSKIEGFLEKIGNIAPDILEVTAKTLHNPLAGVGLVLQKRGNKIRLVRPSEKDQPSHLVNLD